MCALMLPHASDAQHPHNVEQENSTYSDDDVDDGASSSAVLSLDQYKVRKSWDSSRC